MTQMPQMVALFNGFGGGASLLVAGRNLLEEHHLAGRIRRVAIAAAAAAGLIGAVTFCGSLVAAAKLQELDLFRKPFSFSGQQVVNAALLVVALLLGAWMVYGASWAYIPLVLVASVLGVLLVMPIGGADMPVVIALLNSYSGLAAAATGFVIDNNVLIIAGSLVGASGVILTQIMCKAMNRSLAHVLFGVLEASSDAPDADEVYGGKIKSTSADEVAMLLDGCSESSSSRATAWRSPRRNTPSASWPLRTRRARRDRRIRHPPGRRPHAGPHERPAGRSRCALRSTQGDGRDQPDHRPVRRGDRDRGQRRRQSGRANRSDQPDRRDADHQRRQGQDGRDRSSGA